jgi:hypothetical protein
MSARYLAPYLAEHKGCELAQPDGTVTVANAYDVPGRPTLILGLQ